MTTDWIWIGSRFIMIQITKISVVAGPGSIGALGLIPKPKKEIEFGFGSRSVLERGERERERVTYMI